MKDKDFKIEVTKGSGPGGQHKNKVETCVKIIHIPTGVTETCQDTRSKNRNLVIAKKRLVDKLTKLEEVKEQEEKNRLRKERIANPVRIRTYNYQTKRVIDHRTKKQVDLDKIMNGELNLLK